MKNEKILSEILNNLFKSRQAAITVAEENLRKCMEHPEYSSLEYKKRTLAFEIGKNEVMGVDSTALRKEYDKTVKEQVLALKKIGFSASDITPNYNCQKCKDSGYVDGELCDCVKAAYEKKLLSMLQLNYIPDFSFSDFDYSVFDKNSGDRMKKLYLACEKFCDVFPYTNVQNLIFLGNTGTGKTCLISAIANDLLKKKFSVIYLTAFELSQTMLHYHIADVNNKKGILDSFLDCDLLVIDDLGTEPIYKNVTLEYFFLIINQRNLDKKHTLVSSNLTLNEMIDRYGERIFSRITDKSKSKIVHVNNSDLRLKIK